MGTTGGATELEERWAGSAVDSDAVDTGWILWTCQWPARVERGAGGVGGDKTDMRNRARGIGVN
jgi:hypothetical protein